MSTLKTQPTKASVTKFINAIEDETRRRDCKTLLKLMKDLTGHKPVMWGDSLIGFGTYHYKYASGREGDWPRTGFSPRKQNLTVYIMPGFSKYGSLLEKLGKHKTSVSCLYIKRLDDVHMPTLKKLIERSIRDMKRMYP